MKKNAIIYLPLLVLVAGIIFSGTALAGSGAAGKIEIINSSSYKVEV
ncbi:MAG: hypothetical protein GY834_14105, partial [Bacteroidetes bacterium]|nr:hypothetical protein [Bacteroidota bacterium]